MSSFVPSYFSKVRAAKGHKTRPYYPVSFQGWQTLVAKDRTINPLTGYINRPCTRSMELSCLLPSRRSTAQYNVDSLSVYTLRHQPLRLGLCRNRESRLLFPPQLLYIDGSIDHWEGRRPPDLDHLWCAHIPPPPSITNRNQHLTLDSAGILNRFAISDPPVNPLRVRFR